MSTDIAALLIDGGRQPILICQMGHQSVSRISISGWSSHVVEEEKFLGQAPKHNT